MARATLKEPIGFCYNNIAETDLCRRFRVFALENNGLCNKSFEQKVDSVEFFKISRLDIFV